MWPVFLGDKGKQMKRLIMLAVLFAGCAGPNDPETLANVPTAELEERYIEALKVVWGPEFMDKSGVDAGKIDRPEWVMVNRLATELHKRHTPAEHVALGVRVSRIHAVFNTK